MTFRKQISNTMAVAMLVAVGFTGLTTAAQAEWPERPVTIVVPAGAGGGTDGTGRLLAAQLKDIFGQPFNVVNQGQGGGVIGITNIKTAEPDGYTIGILYNFAHYKPMGQADFEVDHFTPIAQYNFDPAGFHVRADSPYTTVTEVLDAIKEKPKDFKIACGGGCGGSWPIAGATLMSKWGIDLTQVSMIPGKGAAAALQDMVAGGFDVVPCSIPEAGPLIEAKRVRGLAVFGSERLKAFPDIPTLKEATDMDLQLGAWRGVVAPAGLPAEIASKLESAIKEIWDSEQFQTAMTDRGFGLTWRNAQDFDQFMRDQETDVKKVIAELGL